MPYTSIITWIVRTCTGLRLSQRKTLGAVAAAAVRCDHVSLANLGRKMKGRTVAKHNIKRVYRFLANPRITASDGAKALVLLAAKAAGGRLIINVDWVDIRQDHVLRAAVPLRGRSLPILFAAYRTEDLHRSRNTLEDAFFVLLKSLLPKGVEAVIVADRGFTRASLARHLQEIGLDYVIRLSRGAMFTAKGKTFRMPGTRLTPGGHIDWGWGRYCKSRPVEQRIVGYWKRKRSEAWILATNLDGSWRRIVEIYRLRMKIEQLFRDEKNARFGWALRQSRLSSPERSERLLLALAFAYLFLLLLGVFCQDSMSAKEWSSTTSPTRPLSVFCIARRMRDKKRCSLGALLRLLKKELLAIVEENWG